LLRARDPVGALAPGHHLRLRTKTYQPSPVADRCPALLRGAGNTTSSRARFVSSCSTTSGCATTSAGLSSTAEPVSADTAVRQPSGRRELPPVLTTVTTCSDSRTLGPQRDSYESRRWPGQEGDPEAVGDQPVGGVGARQRRPDADAAVAELGGDAEHLVQRAADVPEVFLARRRTRVQLGRACCPPGIPVL